MIIITSSCQDKKINFSLESSFVYKSALVNKSKKKKNNWRRLVYQLGLETSWTKHVTSYTDRCMKA